MATKKHVVTQQDIETNPELEGQVQVGEEIELGPVCTPNGHYIICDKWKGEVDVKGNFEQLKKVQENIPLEETDIETLNAMTGPLNPFKFIPVQ